VSPASACSRNSSLNFSSENSVDVNGSHIPNLPKNASRSIVHLKLISLITPSVGQLYDAEVEEMAGISSVLVERA
jgi:hypothetical protein